MALPLYLEHAVYYAVVFSGSFVQGLRSMQDCAPTSFRVHRLD